METCVRSVLGHFFHFSRPRRMQRQSRHVLFSSSLAMVTDAGSTDWKFARNREKCNTFSNEMGGQSIGSCQTRFPANRSSCVVPARHAPSSTSWLAHDRAQIRMQETTTNESVIGIGKFNETKRTRIQRTRARRVRVDRCVRAHTMPRKRSFYSVSLNSSIAAATLSRMHHSFYDFVDPFARPNAKECP